MSKNKKIAVFALCIALAFALSFLETLIPFNVGVPGVKIGLANIVVVASLYLLDKRASFAISMIRILISGLLFSGAFS
ncbi:MAG: Gx transporter family protein, partial [Eubacterium sp.]|nr:Gx transporter family protein [Eubacterium sp.]